MNQVQKVDTERTSFQQSNEKAEGVELRDIFHPAWANVKAPQPISINASQ